MRVHLDEKWSDTLRGFPENGMGYQRVDVLLRDGRAVRNVLVFNAEEMEWPDDRPIRSGDITKLTMSATPTTPEAPNWDHVTFISAGAGSGKTTRW